VPGTTSEEVSCWLLHVVRVSSSVWGSIRYIDSLQTWSPVNAGKGIVCSRREFRSGGSEWSVRPSLLQDFIGEDLRYRCNSREEDSVRRCAGGAGEAQ